jgi:biotin carboxyl carrier protein
MADELNGRAPNPGGLRVTFARGSAGAPATPEAPGATAVAAPGTPAVAASAVIGAGAAGTASVDGIERRAKLELLDRQRARLTTEEGQHDVLVALLPDARRTAAGVERVEIVIDGWRFEFDVEQERRARLRQRATSTGRDGARGGPVELHAIIPGRVVSVDVAEGDTVEAGERLLVLEAMKMQNEIRAARGGTIGRVLVGEGQTVELDELLLVIE